MSEYWVSNERYFCKFCKCWLSGNKLSIKFHESGLRHQQVMVQFHRDKKREKLHGARDEADLKRQLREIEEAAKKQLEKDITTLHFAGSQPLPPPAPPPPIFVAKQRTFAPAEVEDEPPPPPPPGPPPESDQNLGLLEAWERRKEDRLKQEAQITASMKIKPGPNIRVVKDSNQQSDASPIGQYEVNGQIYLDGKHHAAKFQKDMDCEIFLEEEDEWMPAIITSIKEFPVPFTSIVQRKVSVQYVRERMVDEVIEINEVNLVPDLHEVIGQNLAENVLKTTVKSEKEEIGVLIKTEADEISLEVNGTDSLQKDKTGQNEQPKTRKRKSRWGPEVPVAEPCEAEIAQKLIDDLIANTDKAGNTEGLAKETVIQHTVKRAVFDILTEADVQPDRIRLLADEKGHVQGVKQHEDAPEINENTGIGGWQTVSVRSYDPKDEEEKQQKQAKENARKHRKKKQMKNDDLMDAEDALGIFDPYKTNIYKGIDLNEEPEDKEDDQEAIIPDKYVKGESAGPISFKKTTKLFGKTNFRRKRSSDED